MADMERRTSPERQLLPFSGRGGRREEEGGAGSAGQREHRDEGGRVKGHYLHLTVRNPATMCHRCSQQEEEGLVTINEENTPPPFIGCRVTQQQKQNLICYFF